MVSWESIKEACDSSIQNQQLLSPVLYLKTCHNAAPSTPISNPDTFYNPRTHFLQYSYILLSTSTFYQRQESCRCLLSCHCLVNTAFDAGKLAERYDTVAKVQVILGGRRAELRRDSTLLRMGTFFPFSANLLTRTLHFRVWLSKWLFYARNLRPVSLSYCIHLNLTLFS